MKLLKVSFTEVALLLMWIESFALSFSSCEDPYQGETFVQYDVQPISSYLSSRPETFSEWIEVLKYADLYNAINMSSNRYTCFAPTNEAVWRFYEEKRISDITELDVDYVKALVFYHILQDTISVDDFIAGGDLPVKTFSGDVLNVEFDHEGGVGEGINALYLNGEAHVCEMNISTANGKVYVLERVMRPLLESLYERLRDDALHDIMCDVFELTGWADTLSIISDTLINPLGEKLPLRRRFTCFAISDEVMRDNNVESGVELANLLGADSDYKNPNNALNRWAAYHIVEGEYSIDNLLERDVLLSTMGDTIEIMDSKLLYPCAKGTLIKVIGDGVSVDLHLNEGANTVALEMQNSDMRVKNGRIHQLTSLSTIPKEVSLSKIYFEPAATSEIASYIDEYGVTGQKWQMYATKEFSTTLENIFTSFKYSRSPQGTIVNANYVRYCTARNNKVDNAYKCLNFDYLYLSLGYLGNATFTIPAIPAGRYRVVVHYLYVTALKNYCTYLEGSNGGLTLFTLDDGMIIKPARVLLYSPLTSAQYSTAGIYDAVVYDQIEFTEMTSHNLTISLDDPVASTSKNYRVMIDYIMFEAITD